MVQKMVKYFYDLELFLTKELVILNNYKGPRKDMMYLILAITKQYIYSQKCFKVKPEFTGLMGRLSLWYQIDKCYAAQHINSNYEKCIKKRNNLF